MIRWQWYSLTEFSGRELYAVVAARVAVFIVEQTCIYQDLDGLDHAADHLVGWSDTDVAAYLRVLGPGTRFPETSIGRVITTKKYRRAGLGRLAMTMAIERIAQRYPLQPIRISAQTYLENFYASFGFQVASDEYLEDGIPHVEMLRTAVTRD